MKKGAVNGITSAAQPDPRLPLRKRALSQLARRASLPSELPREFARDESTGAVVAIKWGKTWHSRNCACSLCGAFIADKLPEKYAKKYEEQ